MGSALRNGPQAAGLWGLIANHRPALEYDWRTKFGFGVNAFLSRQMSWREAWALTSELLRDPDSHLVASLNGWSYVPGAAQRVGVDLFEGYVNSKRAKNTTPFKATRPWTKPAPRGGRVTTEDREQRSRLDRLLYGGGPLTD